MEKYINALNELRAINQNYNISNKTIDTLLVSMKESKVCTPIIGRFSSGKSALINLILKMSKKLLKEAITPETAVPCEIIYTDSEEKAIIFYNNDEKRQISFDEFRNLEADANTVKKTVVEINNSVLSEFPNVMIVDMPGFESGFEIHNKAIDDYVAKSLAYIIAIPADQMVITSSLGNILKELCIHDMPICVAITKMDKVNDGYEESLQLLQQSLRKFIGNREVPIYETSSFEGDSGEIEEYLCSIHNRSSEILKSKLNVQIKGVASETTRYLTALSKSMEISESDLNEKVDIQQKKLKKLESDVAYEKELFENDVKDCLCRIRCDVQSAFEEKADEFTVKLMNKQNITESINTIARAVVAKSKKAYFDPVVERYTGRICSCITESMNDMMGFECSFNSPVIDGKTSGDSNIQSTISKLAGAGLTSGLAAVAPTFAPVPSPFPGSSIIVGIVSYIFKKAEEKKQREEAKRATREHVINELIPKAVDQICEQVALSINRNVIELTKAVNDDLEKKKELIEKTIRDIRADMEKENKEKESKQIQIRCDIERIGEMINEL